MGLKNMATVVGIVQIPMHQDVPGGPLQSGVHDLSTGEDHIIVQERIAVTPQSRLSRVWESSDADGTN